MEDNHLGQIFITINLKNILLLITLKFVIKHITLFIHLLLLLY